MVTTPRLTCPACGSELVAAADSTSAVAFFDCPHCLGTWSARLRDNTPISVIEVWPPSMFCQLREAESAAVDRSVGGMTG